MNLIAIGILLICLTFSISLTLAANRLKFNYFGIMYNILIFTVGMLCLTIGLTQVKEESYTKGQLSVQPVRYILPTLPVLPELPDLPEIGIKDVDPESGIVLLNINGDIYTYTYTTTSAITTTTTTEPEESTYDIAESTNLGTFTCTAYCSCAKCCGKTDGITATGTHATANRTIAVDPKVIPYGSTVLIDGVAYIAEDCGGAIKTKRIDIYFDSHEEALEYGVQEHEVVIIN